MAKDRYYTPLQSVPGIVAMPIALSVIAACVFGPKPVLDSWVQGAETLVQGIARAPEFISNIAQLIR
jgi:hypothetical protein